MKATEVSRYVTLGEEAKKILTPEISANDFIEALISKQLHPDAVQFIAHLLPKRQAVWWALGCVKQSAEKPTPDTASLPTSKAPTQALSYAPRHTNCRERRAQTILRRQFGWTSRQGGTNLVHGPSKFFVSY